jgi:hypothetical protein
MKAIFTLLLLMFTTSVFSQNLENIQFSESGTLRLDETSMHFISSSSNLLELLAHLDSSDQINKKYYKNRIDNFRSMEKKVSSFNRLEDNENTTMYLDYAYLGHPISHFKIPLAHDVRWQELEGTFALNNDTLIALVSEKQYCFAKFLVENDAIIPSDSLLDLLKMKKHYTSLDAGLLPNTGSYTKKGDSSSRWYQLDLRIYGINGGFLDNSPRYLVTLPQKCNCSKYLVAYSFETDISPNHIGIDDEQITYSSVERILIDPLNAEILSEDIYTILGDIRY